MLLVIQIAAGILLAALIYKGVPLLIHKVNERAEEEKYIRKLAAEMKSDREGDAEWLSSTKKKD